MVTQLFAQGLPKSLMETFFDLYNPETFKEWALSAQKNDKVWLKKQATRGSFNMTQLKGQLNTSQKDNSSGDVVTKEMDKPITVGAKASGMEVTQGSLDPLIQMLWI
jgi:hypothetical protein